MCEFIDIATWEAQSVGGGRKFSRKFDKKSYPILGDDTKEKEVIHLRGISSIETGSSLMPDSKRRRNYEKCLSTTVSEMIDLCRDPKTGRWRWPVNGVDLVYPNIYLGDE